VRDLPITMEKLLSNLTNLAARFPLRFDQAIKCDREFAQANARGVPDGIRDRAGRAGDAELAHALPPRRFPPPRSVEEHNQACFIVRDKSGQALGYSVLRGGSRRR
jgi:hypothetical protein